jgi:hypothetical protein
MRSIRVGPLLAIAMLAVLTACDPIGGLPDGGPPDGGPPDAGPCPDAASCPDAGPDAGTALVRVVQASADQPALDVYVKGTTAPLFTRVQYGTTTSLKPLPTGDVILELRAAGSAPDSTPLHTTPPLMLPDAIVDLITAGSTTPDPESSFRVLALPEGFAQPAPEGIRARFVHASTDAPSVELDISGPPVSIHLNLFSDSGAAGVDLPAGPFPAQLQVVSGSSLLASFTLPPLPGGSRALMVLTGGPSPAGGGDGFKLLVAGLGLVPQITSQVEYFVQTSPDLPLVDVFYDGAMVDEDVSFGGLARIDFAKHASPGWPSPDFRTHAGVSVFGGPGSDFFVQPAPSLVLIAGFLDPPPGRLQLEEDEYGNHFLPPDATTAKVTFVHASPDVADIVDFGVMSQGTFSKLNSSYGSEFRTEDYPFFTASIVPGSYTIGVRPTGGSSNLLEADVTFSPGNSWLVLAGSGAGVGGNDLRLLLVNATADPWTVTSFPRNP